MTTEASGKAQTESPFIKCALAQHFPECVVSHTSSSRFAVSLVQLEESFGMVYSLRAHAGKCLD